jgi:virulence-associated protein VapD
MQMKCTCNAYKSNYAALFTDLQRILNPAGLEFPVIPQEKTDDPQE